VPHAPLVYTQYCHRHQAVAHVNACALDEPRHESPRDGAVAVLRRWLRQRRLYYQPQLCLSRSQRAGEMYTGVRGRDRAAGVKEMTRMLYAESRACFFCLSDDGSVDSLQRGCRWLRGTRIRTPQTLRAPVSQRIERRRRRASTRPLFFVPRGVEERHSG
jgi:hypothetical protein